MAKKTIDPDHLLFETKKTVIDLLKELKVVFNTYEEITDFDIVILFFRHVSEEKIMDHIIDKVLPHKKMIENRNQNFFVQNSQHIFKGIPEDRIQHYTDEIVKGDRIEDEDRECVWEYFDYIIELVDDYKYYKKMK